MCFRAQPTSKKLHVPGNLLSSCLKQRYLDLWKVLRVRKKSDNSSTKFTAFNSLGISVLIPVGPKDNVTMSYIGKMPWLKKPDWTSLEQSDQCCSVVPCCSPRDGARPVSPKERPWWEHRNLSERIERERRQISAHVPSGAYSQGLHPKMRENIAMTYCNDIQWCHDRSRNMQKYGMDWYGTEYGLVRTCLPSTTRSSNSHRTSQHGCTFHRHPLLQCPVETLSRSVCQLQKALDVLAE